MLALGGTATGTGINCPLGFAALAIAAISDLTGLAFTEAENHFEAQVRWVVCVCVCVCVRRRLEVVHSGVMAAFARASNG